LDKVKGVVLKMNIGVIHMNTGNYINENYCEIPIYKTIQRKLNEFDFEKTGEYNEIPKSKIDGDPNDYFCMKVIDDSMDTSRLYEGDILLVRKQADVKSCEIAVVIMNDGKIDIRKVIKKDDFTILQPDSINPIHRADFVKKDERIVIVGKVVSVTFTL
jgi:repressor LexA